MLAVVTMTPASVTIFLSPPSLSLFTSTHTHETHSSVVCVVIHMSFAMHATLTRCCREYRYTAGRTSIEYLALGPSLTLSL